MNREGANPNYIKNFLEPGLGVPLGVFGPNYKTPRSVQMNFGIQREIRPGMVFSADFLRNVETHSLLGVDVNHDGGISNFNLAAAQGAIAATNGAFGCATVDCAIAGGATMADYGKHGLASDVDFGQACNQAIGVQCTFGGINPNQNAAVFLQPIGRSVYNALQMKLVQNLTNPVKGLKAVNFQVAYSLSRFENSGGAAVAGTAPHNDQDFHLGTTRQEHPNPSFTTSLLYPPHPLPL